jgi:hypothetical protein
MTRAIFGRPDATPSPSALFALSVVYRCTRKSVNVPLDQAVPVGAVRFRGISGGDGLAGECILPNCYHSEMFDVDAGRSPAQVVDHEAVRDGTTPRLPRESVSESVLPAVFEYSVPGAVEMPIPDNASTCYGRAVPLKSFGGRDRRREFAGSSRALVMRPAKASSQVRAIAIGHGTSTLGVHRGIDLPGVVQAAVSAARLPYCTRQGGLHV